VRKHSGAVPPSDGARLAVRRSVNALSAAVASAIFPGLGQALQGRYLTGAMQLGSVIAYLLAAVRLGRGQLGWAVLVNLWSVIDAMWWSRTYATDSEDDRS
jgi:hypothetical protein